MTSSLHQVRAATKYALLLLVLCLLMQGEVAATNLTLFRTVYNTDTYSAGVGGMYTAAGGRGTINISGLSGSVTSAYVFWHGQTNYSDVSIGSQITVNGVTVTGVNLGSSDDNGWNLNYSRAYRADITGLVAPNPNRSYLLQVLQTNIFDPNGASIVIFYNGPNPDDNRDVWLFNGNDSNEVNPFDANGWNASLTGLRYRNGTPLLQLHVSDGQTYTDPAMFMNGAPYVSAGAIFQGNTVPSANNGPQNNGSLWDIKNFSLNLTPGINNLSLTTPQVPTNWDALSVVIALAFIPASARSPVGVLDGVDANGNATGWSVDPDESSQAINVDFYVDGPIGTGTFAGTATANSPRTGTGYPGNHGFTFSIPSQFRDGQQHTLYAYGVDVTGDANGLLTGSPKNFTLQTNITLTITNARVSGDLSNTMQNALNGADVVLHANATPAGGAYLWTANGRHEMPGVNNQPDVIIRFPQSGTYQASVAYTLNGNTVTRTVNVNVVEAIMTSFTATEVSNVIDKGRNCSNIFRSQPYGTTYTLGCYQAGGAETGINWTATVEIPTLTYITDPAQSGIKFVQGVSVFRKRLNSGNIQCRTQRISQGDVASGWQLDTVDPYNHSNHPPLHFIATNQLQMGDFDAPGTPLEPSFPVGNYDAVFVDDRFEVYVFYFTGNDAGNPVFQVPLKLTGSTLPYSRIAWQWGGQSIFDPSIQNILYREQFTLTVPGSLSASGTNMVVSFQTNAQTLSWVMCPGETMTTNPIYDSQFFVAQQFRDFFGREPNPGESNSYRGQITACAFDKPCIAQGRFLVSKTFFDSASFHQGDAALRYPPGHPRFDPLIYNPAYVGHAYMSYLRRNPSSAELTTEVNLLNTTSDYNGLISRLVTSSEYRARFGTP